MGGAEIVAFNIAEFCNKPSQKFEFVIVELHKTQDEYSRNKKKELESKKIPFISLGPKSKNISLLVDHFVLAYHVLKQKPDIIHSHTDLPDLVVSNTKRLFTFFHWKFPRIVRTIHNTMLWPSHDFLGKYVEKSFEEDWIAGVSEQSLMAYEELRNKYGMEISVHRRVIYNGCNMPEISEHPFKINSDKINIAFCGRFEMQKGIDILIERIKLINAKYKDEFLFHIIGDGTFKNEVVKLSNEYDNVLVYNAVPNISNKLKAFDYLIMPSRFEGLVLISIEASLSKVPVIAAYAKGLSETLPVGWPLQFNLDDEHELMSIFEKIKEKEYNLQTLKNQAYNFATEKFSLKRMVEEYSQLYSEVNR